MKKLVAGAVLGAMLCMPVGANAFGYGRVKSRVPARTAQQSCYVADIAVSMPYQELSQGEVEALTYMIEEEKMARDVYTKMAELWALPIFSRISSSEQRHMNAVKALIDKYGINATISDEIGVFSNADISSLYTQLVEMGSVSIEDALKVGALIEETDIRDLKERLEVHPNFWTTRYPDFVHAATSLDSIP